MKTVRTTVTSVRLYPEVLMWLNKMSRKTARTKSFYINQALIEMIEDQEDIKDAEKILARIKSGKEKTIPAEELYKELGL